jgi:Spy/CpxP family protein refolding chaperone
MKKVCAFVLVCLVAATVAAQDADKDKKKPEDKTPVVSPFKGQVPQGWTKPLSLTPPQSQKLREINAAYKAKIMALQDQITALRAQERTDCIQVLTDAQKKVLGKSVGLEK